MSGATRLIQKRRHGFVSRMKSAAGRRLIMKRRVKGRKKLGH
jgi:large subunit ribosomal protein L34